MRLICIVKDIKTELKNEDGMAKMSHPDKTPPDRAVS